jgi:hypothetical protein
MIHIFMQFSPKTQSLLLRADASPPLQLMDGHMRPAQATVVMKSVMHIMLHHAF